ncbi:MAG: bifunctional NAD(P)H-hydrate repair enzyme [marine bacterium B5-7]|nr:MAG: bifunctional NAD(P)H-hydrate repair enzyme [marine bacterium B5-7]
MNELPNALYDAAATRALDHQAIHQHSIPGYELMRLAGREAYRVMRSLWPENRQLVVFCGAGNNGGDGYVVAGLAARDGYDVKVIALGEPRTDDANRACNDAIGESDVDGKGRIQVIKDLGTVTSRVLDEGDLVVDAILGTGLSRAPQDGIAMAIAAINSQSSPVYSLDIPSGLNADNGNVPGEAVIAQATSTFIGLKIGLLTGSGPDVVGELFFHDLDVPAAVYDAIPAIATRITSDLVKVRLPVRRRCAHKGDRGHVVLVGGNKGLTGAVRIAARTAARSGAGLVTAATRADNAIMVNVQQPEIMVVGVETAAELVKAIEGCDAFGIGPGLGLDQWSTTLFDVSIRSSLPRVIDADALNLLARNPSRDGNWVLTPHPGEAARLLGCTIPEISADRPAAVREIVRRYGGVCVLKGCGTLIADEQTLWLCNRGNSGMATGGMGDCLTGLITSLLGQKLDPLSAAICGVWLHARAAELEAADQAMTGILASDLIPWLRRLLDDPHD